MTTSMTLPKNADAPQENGAPEPPDRKLGAARAKYYNARDEARRYNRNLLQFAGAVAAVIGIGSGSAGLLAVANGVDGGSHVVETWIFVAVAIAAIATAVGLLLPLGWAFVQRGRAEQNVREEVQVLLQEDPDFRPSE